MTTAPSEPRFTCVPPYAEEPVGHPPMPDLADYMTTEEAAKSLDFHIAHVRRMLREGDLEGIKFKRDWLVSRKSVLKYLKDTEGTNKFDPRRGNE